MPKIACPGCQKQYSLPESAAGKVATCKACGKKFRLSKASATPPTPKQPAAKSSPRKQAPKKVAATTASVADSHDPFWDDSLPEQRHPQPQSATQSTATQPHAIHPALAPKQKPKKKKRKKRKLNWGVDWGKVGGGLMTFLIAGGLTTVAALTTGRLYFWGVGIAIVGLFTALSGLMGEEGVW